MIRRLLRAALFLLPVLILLPNLGRFPFPPGSPFSDLVISHYPNALFVQRSLTEWKTVPLWSPTILSGYPFAADPLSGLYYLPGWFVLLFPLVVGFNLLVVLHLILGGVGLYCLLRAEGLPENAALFGAFAFEAMPKLFSHLAAGHISLLYAVPWTPWLLLAELSAQRSYQTLQSRDRFSTGLRILTSLLPGLVLGIILLADVRWGAYAGLVWVGYRLWHTGKGVSFRTSVVWIVGPGLFALLVAAPLLVPLAEYTRLSTRAALTPQESFILSLNPVQLLGLIYPYLRGPAEWCLYPGALVAALFLLGLSLPVVRRKAGFWMLLVAVTLVFSLGSYLPGLPLLAHLPGFSLLRVPPRVLFLCGLGFAAAAAYTFNALTTGSEAAQMRAGSGRMLFGVTALVVLFGAAAAVVVPQAAVRLQFGWGALLFLLSMLFIFLARFRRVGSPVLFVMATVLLLADLSAVNALALDFRSSANTFVPGAASAAYLSAKENVSSNLQGPFRVYSPSYSLPQQVAGLFHLELADGVDPLQLASYAAFFQPASGVPAPGYSVTLPPFQSGEPAMDNQAYRPDAQRLGLLNVRYVVAAYELPGSQLYLLAHIEDTYIYRNPFALPRAWVQNPDFPPGKSLLSTPWLTERPNAILIQAQGPGLLVLSQVDYPGWRAYLDGQPVQIQKVANLLQGVLLPPGPHTVDFVFRPFSVYLGLGLGALAWISLLILLLFVRRGRP